MKKTNNLNLGETYTPTNSNLPFETTKLLHGTVPIIPLHPFPQPTENTNKIYSQQKNKNARIFGDDVDDTKKDKEKESVDSSKHKQEQNKERKRNNVILPQIIFESIYCPICEVSYWVTEKDEHKQIHFNRLNQTRIVQIPNFEFKSFAPIPELNIESLISNVLLTFNANDNTTKSKNESNQVKKEANKQGQVIPLSLSAKKPDDWLNMSPEVLRTSNLSERSNFVAEESIVSSVIEENNDSMEINDTLKIKSKIKRLPSNILARPEHSRLEK